jgi:hypothetical protein
MTIAVIETSTSPGTLEVIHTQAKQRGKSATNPRRGESVLLTAEATKLADAAAEMIWMKLCQVSAAQSHSAECARRTPKAAIQAATAAALILHKARRESFAIREASMSDPMSKSAVKPWTMSGPDSPPTKLIRPAVAMAMDPPTIVRRRIF